MSIALWLDDERQPPSLPYCGYEWTWVKTADQAIEALKTGDVAFASLDHDLADEHYFALHLALQAGAPLDTTKCREKTGMSVIDWMEEHNVWPEDGVRVHTQNGPGRDRMLLVVNKIYGRTFQYRLKGVTDGLSGQVLF